MEWDNLFKTGTHTDMNGHTQTYSNQDIQRIATSKVGAPVYIHHPLDKNKAMQFGSVAELRVSGDLLQAKYKDIPTGLESAVEAGLNLNKSIAFDPDTMELDHVGLLGADQEPAVDGLGHVVFAQNNKKGHKSTVTYIFSKLSPDGNMGIDSGCKDKEITTLKEEIKTMKNDKSTEDLQNKLESAKKELQVEKDAHKETKAAFAKFKTDQEDKELKSRVSALVESGKISGADKDKTLSFAKNLTDSKATMTFAKADGKEEKVSPREAYLRDLELRPDNGDGLLSEFAGGDGAGKKTDKSTFDLSKINDYA